MFLNVTGLQFIGLIVLSLFLFLPSTFQEVISPIFILSVVTLKMLTCTTDLEEEINSISTLPQYDTETLIRPHVPIASNLGYTLQTVNVIHVHSMSEKKYEADTILGVSSPFCIFAQFLHLGRGVLSEPVHSGFNAVILFPINTYCLSIPTVMKESY